MSIPTKPLALVLLVALGGALAWHLHGQRAVAKAAPASESETSGDTVRYPAGASQLSYLEIEPVHAVPAPAMDAQPGKIAFDEDHTVRVMSPANGRVTQLVAEPGAVVKQGDVLAWIDSPDYAQARADASKAAADSAAKAKALGRAAELTRLGVLAQKDLEAAEDDAAQARAEAARASEVLRNLDPSGHDGPRYALRAPIAGTVVDRTINPGLQVQSGGAPLFVITDASHLWASFEVPERDAGKVRAGQRASVEVDALPGERFDAHILYVGGALDPSTRRFTVRAALDKPDERLKPEMFARITPIDAKPAPLVAVPNTALVNMGLHHYVFVEIAPGTLQRREVRLGLAGENRSWLREGVREGERVVTRGAVLLNGELAE
ncbi:efflux RND transporter periplasmic adaptor subunit [Frateuria defendens]|uniref:efflux RND transporter periplasmic adaptor subunit n=1 Tax=Frateuria defendens TaxID=2219559 RepID=UPI00066FC2F5|nr:efflux RND transporter periplasmic adaptor subunit [Frateuria defendens]